MGYVAEEESQNTVAINTQDQPIVTSPTEIPFSAGRKRDFRGNIVNNHIVSPIPITPKGNMGEFGFLNNELAMPLSDIHNQTQADNSPPPSKSPLQDHIFERPSPNFRPALSSPPQRAFSSPTKITDDTPEADHPPRSTYVSIVQSQELRDRRMIEQVRSSSPDLMDDEDDDELGDDSLEFRQAKEREKARLKQEAAKQLAQLSYSVPPVSRHVTSVQKTRYGSRDAPISLVTPSTARQPSKRRIIMPDIRVGEEDLADNAGSDDEPYDEYDELTQTVLTGDRPEDMEDVLGPTPNRFPGSAPRSKLSRSASSPLKRQPINTGTDANMRAIPATQQSSANDFLHLRFAQPRVAVENSQPTSTLQQTDSTVARLVKNMQPSSIDSKGFISESQSVGLTLSSGNGGLGTMPTIPLESIMSSIPLAPVMSSQTSSRSEDDGKERMRDDSPASSPPPTVPRLEKSECDKIGDVDVTAEVDAVPEEIAIEDPVLEKEDDEAVVENTAVGNEDGRDGDDELVDVDNVPDLVGDNEEDEKETADQLDHLTRLREESQTPAETLLTPQVPADQGRTRRSNRKRHQIPDSSAVQSSPVRTERSAVTQDHTDQELGLHEKDNDNIDEELDESANDEIVEGQTDSTNLYLTAHSNQKTSDEQQQSETSPAKPRRTSTRILKMSEIARQASPEQSSAEFQAGKIEMNIMDDDDFEFEAMMNRSGPPRKKPRVTYGRKVLPPSSPAESRSSPLTPLPTEDTPPKRKSVRLAAQHTLESRGNEEPERQSTGKLKRTRIVPSPARGAVKKSFTFEVSESPQPEPVTSARSKTAARSLEIPMTEELHDVAEEHFEEDAEMADAGGDTDLVSDAPLSYVVPPPYSTSNPSDHRVPDRVIARFLGTNMAYYPATCLGPVALGASTYRVRFDDGTVAEVEAHLVRRFELRPGENVRVDLPNMRKNTWIVKGFKNNIAEVATQTRVNVKTDIHGFQTVKLEARQRKSLPAAGQMLEPETIDVAITNIYLTLQMINQLKGREYHHPQAKVSSDRMATPFNIIAAIPSTPPSRTRRKTISDHPPPSRTLSLASEFQSGLFTNMAFVISYKDDKQSRDQVTKLILNHGGLILSHGLDELFEITAPHVQSPSKSPSASNASATRQLTLSSTASKLGFTVLIADAFSRKEKYLQALALNIPCLCGRWVVDTVARSTLLPLDRYLLPAGESAFLHGAVRSRTFSTIQTESHDPQTAKLANMIGQRSKLAQGRNVIVVTGATKSAEDKRKAHLFLMSAIGADRIEKVRDLTAASVLLEQGTEKWDWVYVDDASTTKTERLLGLGNVGSGAEVRVRKRKRGQMHEGEAASASNRRIKVVNDEFVVQSLILGSLAEDV